MIIYSLLFRFYVVLFCRSCYYKFGRLGSRVLKAASPGDRNLMGIPLGDWQRLLTWGSPNLSRPNIYQRRLFQNQR